ncbi:MAG: hypothetical protein ABSF80_03220 [Chitinispirillaceae bacterium]
MKKTVIAVLISALLVAGCAIGFMGGHRGRNLIIVPALPVTVELDADQFYYQNGYYYHYDGNIWFYSERREGPWSQLPRSHYPREVHFRGHDNRQHN